MAGANIAGFMKVAGRDDLAGRELLKRLLPSETRRPPEPHRKMGRRGKRRTSVFAGGENLGAGAIHLPRACEIDAEKSRCPGGTPAFYSYSRFGSMYR